MSMRLHEEEGIKYWHVLIEMGRMAILFFYVFLVDAPELTGLTLS